MRSGFVRAGQMPFRLHLDQATRGALEFELKLLAMVKRVWASGGREDQVDVAVIELIDEGDEATRGVLTCCDRARADLVVDSSAGAPKHAGYRDHPDRGARA